MALRGRASVALRGRASVALRSRASVALRGRLLSLPNMWSAASKAQARAPTWFLAMCSLRPEPIWISTGPARHGWRKCERARCATRPGRALHHDLHSGLRIEV